MIYELLLRPLLFSRRRDPEDAHERVLALLRAVERRPAAVRLLTRWFRFDHPVLQTRLLGRAFLNPVGLAAGFDKNAMAPRALGSLGFAAVEVGGVTRNPLPGNARPRISRDPSALALTNWMGLPNEGAERIAERLAAGSGSERPVLGLNVSGSTVEEYLQVVELCGDSVDYLTLNVSCPNVPAARQLCEPAAIAELLSALTASRHAGKLPSLLKVSPDLDDADLAGLVEIAAGGGAAGFVATNTSARLSGGRGGVSGAPLRERSTEVVRRLYRETAGRLTIIGVGGIFTAADAYEKILAGANAVQVYTGLIYRGPSIARAIKAGLVALLAKDGYASVSEAVGAAHRPGAAGHRPAEPAAAVQLAQ